MSDVLYFLMIGILFYVMMRWGCGAHMMGGGHGDHAGEPPEKRGQTVKDPVCGMDLDVRTAQHLKPYRGGIFYFCSARCQEKFGENPENYMGKSG